MTDEFRGLTEELAKGLNFPENAVIMGTAINNDEIEMYDITIHFWSQKYYPVECIIKSIIENFLKPLDDDTAKYARDMLLDIIERDRQRRND